MTPRMFHALIQRYENRLVHEELISAIVAETVANHGFRYYAEPPNVTDYMPSQRLKRLRSQAQPEELTPEELQSKLNRIFGT